MIINLIFDQSNAPASFTSQVTSAALMLERAITDPITVTIEVGYGVFPTDQSPITGGAAEAEPNGNLAASFSYSDVVSALTVSAAAIGDTNFDALPVSTSVTGYNGQTQTTSAYSNVLVWSAEAKALGFIAANQSGVDGYAGFATDIPANALVGVALHELGHALGRVPNGLPFDNNIPDIYDLFRFDSANKQRLVYDNGGTSPAAYFSVNGPVNGGGTALANWGETSDPSDFLSGSQTINDPFDEFYVPGATCLSRNST